MQNIQRIKLLKEEYCKAGLNRWELRSSLQIRSDGKLRRWVADPLRMRYAFWVDGKAILKTQAIKLSKIGNIFTAIVRNETGFRNAIQGVVNYARAFGAKIGLRSIDLLMMNNVNDKMS